MTENRRSLLYYYGLLVMGAVLAYLYQDAVMNGVQVTVQRTMACSKDRAFQAVTDFNVMPLISDDVLKYEFDDDDDSPKTTTTTPTMYLNMKFSEHRKMGKNDDDVLITNLEVTELDAHHARMVADTHGTIWDTTFDVTTVSTTQVALEIAMHARAHETIPKFLNPIMQVLFRYGLNAHIDQVKIWCEQNE